MESKNKSRSVASIVKAKETKEGVGAVVKRSIGTKELDSIDPFLMLDEAYVQPPAGFPNHPHRGFETVSYMLEGSFKHEDSKGNAGTINAGDVQWMTAGRGIVHSEMPGSNGVSHGLQLWVNLAAKDKLCEPRYQELKSSDIPEIHHADSGISIRIIAGEAEDKKAPTFTRTPAYYLDFRLKKKGISYEQKIPVDFNAFIYILKGQGKFGNNDKPGSASDCLIFELDNNTAEFVKFESTGDEELHLVLIAGKPIKEPVQKYGPFVMNNMEEINQALQDYRQGRF